MRSNDEQLKTQSLFAIIDEMLRLKSCFEVLFAEVQNLAALSTLEKLVLSAVLHAPVPLTVPQIGRQLGYLRQVIQRVANDLVSKGLLEKAPNPHHSRAALLVPTAAALAMKRKVEERAIKTAKTFLKSVSARKCARLTSELRVFREAVEAFTQTETAGLQRGEGSVSVTQALALL